MFISQVIIQMYPSLVVQCQVYSMTHSFRAGDVCSDVHNAVDIFMTFFELF